MVKGCLTATFTSAQYRSGLSHIGNQAFERDPEMLKTLVKFQTSAFHARNGERGATMAVTVRPAGR